MGKSHASQYANFGSLQPAVSKQTLLGIEYYINHLFLEKFKTPVSTQENFSSLVAEEAETYTTNSQKE